MEAMSLSLSTVSDHTVLTVRGEVDLHTAPQLRDTLVDLCAEPQDMVIDLNDVDFLDSTALGLIVGAMQRLHAGGRSLQVVCAKPRILKVFRITGLDRVIPLHASIPDAVTSDLGRSAAPDPRSKNDRTGP